MDFGKDALTEMGWEALPGQAVFVLVVQH